MVSDVLECFCLKRTLCNLRTVFKGVLIKQLLSDKNEMYLSCLILIFIKDFSADFYSEKWDFFLKSGDKVINCITVGIEQTIKAGIFLIRIRMSQKSLEKCQKFFLEN